MIEKEQCISCGCETRKGVHICAKCSRNLDIAIRPRGKEGFALTINGKTVFVGKRYEVFDKLKEILG